MKKEILKSLRIAALFCACGLFVSLLVFFLLFGKGLQLLMPFVLFVFFFGSIFFLEKIPFTSEKPVIKGLVVILLIIIILFLL